jgi:hypothetical protein
MKAAMINIEDKIDQLVAILDRDIQFIQKNLSRLTDLRSFLIKHDDAALANLLEEIKSDSNTYSANELQRQQIRKELAIAAGCDPRQMNLSKLETMLPAHDRNAIFAKKIKLQALARELKREHTSTARLLADCSRFNSMLLKNVFNIGRTGIVYNSNGSAKLQEEIAFVNMRF